LLLAVASMVPLLAFSLGSQYLQYRDAVDAAGRQTLEIARSMSLVVDQELRTRMVALQVLAGSPALRGNDIATFRAQAQAVIAQRFPGSNLILLREDGQQLMNTLLPPDAPLPVRPNLDSMRRVFATGLPAVSDMYMGAIGPRLVVAIDVPVERDDGSVAYVLSTNPQLDDFGAGQARRARSRPHRAGTLAGHQGPADVRISGHAARSRPEGRGRHPAPEQAVSQGRAGAGAAGGPRQCPQRSPPGGRAVKGLRIDPQLNQIPAADDLA
jgi:hypothetical protein